MAIHVGQHWLVNVGATTLHMDTLVTLWSAMGIVVLGAALLTKNLQRKPSTTQTFLEIAIGFIEGIALNSIGPKEGKKHASFIASLFLVVLAGNLIGHLPLRLFHLHKGEFASPTNDLNVTVALAVLAVIYYFYAGISKKGLGYFKHYVQPFWFMAPFNLLEDFTRPLSLSFRLFGNILAGEVLIAVLLSFCFLLLPLPMMFFEIFVAFIQAFIFSTLTAAYISMAVADNH